jgi:hypothetical protein
MTSELTRLDLVFRGLSDEENEDESYDDEEEDEDFGDEEGEEEF